MRWGHDVRASGLEPSAAIRRVRRFGLPAGCGSVPLGCLPDPVQPGCVYVRVLRRFYRVEPPLEPVELAVQRPHVVRQEQDPGCCDRCDCRREEFDWCCVHARFPFLTLILPVIRSDYNPALAESSIGRVPTACRTPCKNSRKPSVERHRSRAESEPDPLRHKAVLARLSRTLAAGPIS